MNQSLTQLQDQMWSEYRARLHRFIHKRINNSAIAEDLVQDVLAKAYRRLDRLESKEKLLPWLYQITRNAIVDHFRKVKPVNQVDATTVIEDVEMDEAAERELACCVLPFIRHLPPAYQQAVTLSEIEGVKLKQVALQQGISLSGAKSRVQRGRQMLKTMFLECCRIERDRRGGVSEYEPKKNCGNCH
jgi:RNA polymerase sigma-70 factor (ECF subfamily)